MSFRPEMVNSFKSSLNFLVDTLMQTITFSTRGEILTSKPSFTVQTEKFSSFLDKISSDQNLLDNLSKKVVGPVYDKHSASFLSRLVGPDGKVDDEFLRVPEFSDGDELKIRTEPRGLFFQVSNVFLPVSEVYTLAVKLSREYKSENLPFRNKILLGLYSTVYHSISSSTPKDQLEIFKENMDILKESLEVCSEVKTGPREDGPMGMIKNLLGNIDFNQIGDMMNKVSGDERSSKEFADVFGRITDTIKSGKNPLEAMSDIIKTASMEAAEEQPQEEVTEQSQEVSEQPQEQE